ncbi:MAG: hypothetical protein VX899_12610 [Myxococcota bacterium]|nr:hypothetical protein [Myxococcota bacterium]
MLLSLLVACATPSGEGPPGWAVAYANVVPEAEGSWRGHQVWVFYEDGWSRQPGAEWHLCTLLQGLEGSSPGQALEGCPECISLVQVQVQNIESDCPEAWLQDPGFESDLNMAVGPLPDDLAVGAPDNSSLGWYSSYGDEPLSPQGYTTSEAALSGREAPQGFAEEQPYTLWPAYAWSLR